MTVRAVRKFKDSGGQFLWAPAVEAGAPATLLGYPVYVCEDMPDIAANSLPIAFGDFRRGYLVNDRTGLKLLRDPYSDKPWVSLYCTKRVAGGVLDVKAIQLQKVSAS